MFVDSPQVTTESQWIFCTIYLELNLLLNFQEIGVILFPSVDGLFTLISCLYNSLSVPPGVAPDSTFTDSTYDYSSSSTFLC